jgi:integrase
VALFKRGKIWWFKFKYAGRPYRESAGTANEQLALKIERKRRREVEEVAHGIRRPSAPVLLSVASKDWLELKEPTWAKKTHVNASLDVGHLKKHLGGLLLSDITDKDIADYITSRRTEKAADKTIRNEIGTLRGILKRHRLWAQLKDDGVRLPRGRDEDTGVALSSEDETKLLAACAASRSRSLLTVVTLALSTGMRHDEMRLLRWRQVDFANEAIKVGKSKTEHGTGRSVPLNKQALKTVQEWSKEFPDRKSAHYVFPSEKVGISGNDEIPQVFDTDPTKPITSWKTAWGTAKTGAGVECRFHDLRHTTVTRLLECGQSFAVVAEIMGWSAGTAVRMAKRYGHIGPSAKRAAMASLDAKSVAASASTDAAEEGQSPGATVH